MIKLNFVEPTDAEWVQWKTDCEEATNLLIQSHQNGKPIEITNLYGEQRGRYYNHPFNGKCAYCESSIEVNSPNYVEHFRPKGGIRDMNNNIINIRGTMSPHPGYYWLAYKWENHLPTCWACNTWHKDKSGVMVGKGNRFPVENQYAELPGEETRERPLLINPLFEDPSAFLYIDNLGIIHSKNSSNRADFTITLFGLNIKDALVSQRKKEYKNVFQKVQLTFIINDKAERDKELSELSLISKGSEPHTIAARKAIADALALAQKNHDEIIIL